MTYAIGAAGTGGHVFPGLAVGEALVEGGVDRSEVLFIGGARLEKEVYPRAGFPFVELYLRGFNRGFDLGNVRLPSVVRRASREAHREMRSHDVAVVLGMGGYVTVPIGLAARRQGAAFFVHEQNAVPGLANRLMARRAKASFVSFAGTRLPRAVETGNPIRSELTNLDRRGLRQQAFEYFQLDPSQPVVGVLGGSLGAAVLNEAAVSLVKSWSGPAVQVLHISGPDHLEKLAAPGEAAGLTWRVRGFEPRMDLYYSAVDIVIARAGGATAELLAAAVPAVLVPGGFGSAGHQDANARALERGGAAMVVAESDVGELPVLLAQLMADRGRLNAMRNAAGRLAKPRAAHEIAAILRTSHD